VRRLATIHRHVFGVLALSSVAASWWGCAEAEAPWGTSSGTGGSSVTETGAGGSGGGFSTGTDGTGGGTVCVSTVETAEATPLDIVFLIDRSGTMQGASWEGSTSALETFFEDPLSDGISAGIVYLPTVKPFGGSGCDTELYKVLDVPIAPLPDNAFNLTNSMPDNATGSSTPLYAALSGALMAATARQDAYPTHKVILVMTGDGHYNTCSADIDQIAAWAKSALDYNGVRTYVIAVEADAVSPENLQKIAEEGGTTAFYDAQDINEFSEKMAEIRTAALGCDFAIPPPPEGEGFVLDRVNFTYTPGGTESPITLPHADDLADCGDDPGWYYDNNTSPSKIIVCPASCATIQNDSTATVAVAFGCATVAN